MDRRSREQRASAAAAGMRKLTSEEEARVRRVMVPYMVVSTVLLASTLVIGIRTAKKMYQARHLGVRPVLKIAASGPVIILGVLELTRIVIDRRLATWMRRIMATPPG